MNKIFFLLLFLFPYQLCANDKVIMDISIPVLTTGFDSLYINELMPKNNIYFDEYGEADDWVELYNAHQTTVSLDGLFLSDDPDNKLKWEIQGPITIAPNSFVLFWLDGDTEQGQQHASFKLDSDGESLLLSQQIDNNLIVLDAIDFGNVPNNISYGRLTDGNEDWVYFHSYSPLASNNDNNLLLNSPIEFSKASGFYDSTIQLSMSTDDSESTIRFTTDGSLPTVSSNLYTSPLTINQTTLIKAAAFKSGYQSNTHQEGFYIINNEHQLPVLHISIDTTFLWDQQEGMYVTGSNGLYGSCSATIKRNWNQDWERPISLRYFDETGTEGFHLNAGMKIGGGCSRVVAQKPLNIFFRNSDYGDYAVNYPLFNQLDIDQFKRFKLRGNGNDDSAIMIRDAAVQAMIYNQVDIDQMGYEPIVVYLNGEYWGYYGMREFFSKHYIGTHYPMVDIDNIDLIKLPYSYPELKEGDGIAWNELYQFVEENDLQIANNYDYFINQIDKNEFINYNILEVYIANWDWPANNMMVWREGNQGKWRWLLFDLDLSSGYGRWSGTNATFNAIDHATTLDGPDFPNGPRSTLFLRKLLANTSFQNEFVQRSCTFAQTIFAPERTTSIIDSISAKVSPEIQATFDKFNNAPAEWQKDQSNAIPGSYDTWQNNLNDFKDFFNDRLTHVLSNFETHFDYDGHFDLHINFDETSNGTVVLHENNMPIPYQYNGQYFSNVPILIRAIPDPGYHFVRWREIEEFTASIYFQTNTNQTLTPIFDVGEVTAITESNEIESIQVFPMPAKNELIIKFPTTADLSFIQIYNSIGQLVYTETLTISAISDTHSLSVENWEAGIYFLETILNNKKIIKKIIVE